ncbi:MAG: FecR domain-containing protein, partial [Lachnospiraceae bacterium]|nr:FecR domain-containing protein [Lachnospiraceae bacterium]
MMRITCKRLLGLFLACTMFVSAGVCTVAAEEPTAATIRLTKTEGTVTAKDKSGADLTAAGGMRLFSGSSLETEARSYAWLSLDDTKAVKLDEQSSALITKNGKNLDVTLNKGNLYFDISKKMEADENFHIRTSTMVMGIRGTMGVVQVLAPVGHEVAHSRIVLLEGTLACSVTDKRTGLTKNIVLHAGDIADFYVYDEKWEGDACDIVIGKASADDVGTFALLEIAQNGTAGRIAGSIGIGQLNANAVQQQLLVQQAQELVGKFDPDYYASRYPDVAAAYGNDAEKLWNHFVQKGQFEGRVGSREQQQSGSANSAWNR